MKVAIITLYGVNYGNRLQNYALYFFLEKMSFHVKNLYIDDLRRSIIIKKTNNILKKVIKIIIPMPLFKWYKKKYIELLYGEKACIFEKFTIRHMNSEFITIYHNHDMRKYIDQSEYCYFFAGSDQIWNPDFAGEDFYFLDFVEQQKRIAFAASIGYEILSDNVLEQYGVYWKNMKYISVREESAAKIIEYTTGRKVDVFLDPTMLLTRVEWKEISVPPRFEIPEKYILCLFLGEVPVKTVGNYRKVYGMKTVMLNDKSYQDYFLTGPSEFLYLVEHADLVLTDSFHCTVFSIIFHRDFVVFKRKDSTVKNMFTRLKSLLDRMGFQDRIWECDGSTWYEKITKERFDKSDDVMKAERKRITCIINDIVKSASDS